MNRERGLPSLRFIYLFLIFNPHNRVREQADGLRI